STALLDIPPTGASVARDGVFYGGNYGSSKEEGVYQSLNGAITQAFVSVLGSPGVAGNMDVTMVKSAFLNNIFIGWRVGTTYLLERTTETRQSSAICRTVWHRFGTDRFKRVAGIKLNLKPMAANTAVTVAYRTSRTGSF